MPLLETLIISLGPSIAKAILKHWLKDSSIASEIGSSLIDLLKQKTSDVVAQKRTARQFEVIGERVAESLAVLFEMEGARISENGRRAVALGVAATLDKGSIDSKLLVERNLEPRQLAEHLRKSDPKATRDFSEAEKSLYDRILLETSQYIVDIGSQLPQFNERAFGELLERQTQLQDIAEQILREVEKIREDTKEEDQRAAQFEVEYRRSVLRMLDELRLFGVDASSASRRHRLSVAYVTLSVRQAQDKTDDDEPAHSVDLAEHEKHEKSGDIEESDEIITADKTLAQNRKLLILGEAGSGKTTLLQWIAVRSAQSDFKEALSQWNDTTPFFIRLRQCADTGLPSPEEFPRFVAPAIAGSMPERWVHDRLRTGRAVVLIDGLDELGLTMRTKVAEWLEDLINSYPEARFVVSSRPYAVEEGWLAEEGFRQAELLPMELSDIDSFIEHWHDAVREELQNSGEQQEIESICYHLKKTVRGSIQIRKLATNPLLCAMLCALHRDRQQRLPSDRIELYDACFRMLVDRRDVERGVDLRDYPELTYRQKRSLLEDFAYWLLKNGYSMVSLRDTEDRFDSKLSNLEGLKDTRGSDVLRLFIERSGILREPIKNEVDFTHRTFQEFLAAQAALDDGDVGLLIKNAHEQDWREVIVLAAGLARSKEREELINHLITRGDNESRFRHQLHMLAVACLETTVELPPSLKDTVKSRLKRLIPPKNFTEAKALSSAGELALPYLENKNRYARITAACIRTLVLIGGENALTILEAYVPDSRVTVANEITRGWDYFDRTEYAKRIFKGSFLQLHVPSSVEGMGVLTNVRSISIANSIQLRDLEPVSHLSELQSLWLHHLGRVRDLTPLSRLVSLTDLHICNCYSSDIGFLSDLRSLTRVSLVVFPNISDFSPLALLSNVTSLTLSSDILTSVEFLSGMASLTKLDLSRCRQLSDLRFISKAERLSDLDLTNCTELSDLSFLEDLQDLTHLNLTNCHKIANLRPLSHLTKLEVLHLQNCEKVTDLEPLYGLHNVQFVFLKNTGVLKDTLPPQLRDKAYN